jgi:hypothetical protein
MNKPTVEEIRDAHMEDNYDYEEVHEESDPSWRHGCYMSTVYKRLTDDTHWMVSWQLSDDGEYNSIRDGDITSSDIVQVEPYEKTVIDYRVVKL